MTDAIGARAEPVPIPWDCADGLFEAYWRRPETYRTPPGGHLLGAGAGDRRGRKRGAAPALGSSVIG